MTEEDRRAIEWQVRQRRIAAHRQGFAMRLIGNAGALQRLRDAWAPVILASREAQLMGDDDPDDCEEWR